MKYLTIFILLASCSPRAFNEAIRYKLIPPESVVMEGEFRVYWKQDNPYDSDHKYTYFVTDGSDYGFQFVTSRELDLGSTLPLGEVVSKRSLAITKQP